MEYSVEFLFWIYAKYRKIHAFKTKALEGKLVFLSSHLYSKPFPLLVSHFVTISEYKWKGLLFKWIETTRKTASMKIDNYASKNSLFRILSHIIKFCGSMSMKKVEKNMKYAVGATFGLNLWVGKNKKCWKCVIYCWSSALQHVWMFEKFVSC